MNGATIYFRLTAVRANRTFAAGAKKDRTLKQFQFEEGGRLLPQTDPVGVRVAIARRYSNNGFPE